MPTKIENLLRSCSVLTNRYSLPRTSSQDTKAGVKKEAINEKYFKFVSITLGLQDWD